MYFRFRFHSVAKLELIEGQINKKRKRGNVAQLLPPLAEVVMGILFEVALINCASQMRSYFSRYLDLRNGVNYYGNLIYAMYLGKYSRSYSRTAAIFILITPNSHTCGLSEGCAPHP